MFAKRLLAAADGIAQKPTCVTAQPTQQCGRVWSGAFMRRQRRP
jgi:hypothetical protein